MSLQQQREVCPKYDDCDWAGEYYFCENGKYINCFHFRFSEKLNEFERKKNGKEL